MGDPVPPLLPPPIDLRVPRSFTAAALGLGTAALAGPAVRAVLPAGLFAGMDAALLWSVGLAAALCSVLSVAIVMRRGALARRRGILAWFAAGGVLTSGLGLFALAGLQGDLQPLMILAGCVGGGLLGAPLGVLFGLAFLPVLFAWERLRRNPSLAGRIVHVCGVGGWLTAAGLLARVVAHDPMTVLLADTCLALGIGAAGIAALVHVGGKQWIAFVAANRVAGWTICDPTEVDVPLGLARWSDRPDPCGARPGILCRKLGGNLLEARVRIPAALFQPTS